MLQYKIQNIILFQLPKQFENEIMYFIFKKNTILYFDRRNQNAKYIIYFKYWDVFHFWNRKYICISKKSFAILFYFLYRLYHISYFFAFVIEMPNLVILIRHEQFPQIFVRRKFTILLQYFQFNLVFFLSKA